MASLIASFSVHDPESTGTTSAPRSFILNTFMLCLRTSSDPMYTVHGMPNSAQVVAAATPDGRALLAYVPPGSGLGQRSFVLDVRALSGPAAARWYNPWTGAFLPVGRVSNAAPAFFTTPGDNGSGYDDWVLVLTRPLEETPRPPAPDAGGAP